MLTIERHQFKINLFPLAKGEQVEKVSNRLRITRARPAADHQRKALVAVGRPYRQSGEIQHVQDGGVAQFILQGKPQKIEGIDRIAAFEAEQLHAVLPHQRLHIGVRRKHPLAPNIRLAVEQTIKDLHPQMGHAHLIQIGKTESEPDRHRVPVLDYAVEFTARIASGLLHLHKQLFDVVAHIHIPFRERINHFELLLYCIRPHNATRHE